MKKYPISYRLDSCIGSSNSWLDNSFLFRVIAYFLASVLTRYVQNHKENNTNKTNNRDDWFKTSSSLSLQILVNIGQNDDMAEPMMFLELYALLDPIALHPWLDSWNMNQHWLEMEESNDPFWNWLIIPIGVILLILLLDPIHLPPLLLLLLPSPTHLALHKSLKIKQSLVLPVLRNQKIKYFY